MTVVAGETIGNTQFILSIVGFVVSRTYYYLRGMFVDSLTSERELVKVCFQLGSSSEVPAGNYTQVLALICALCSSAASKLGPESAGIKQ